MANQTITTDANHDDLTGRLADETITIQEFATLTLDSEPQHTPMGLMGSLTLTAGTINIDGTKVRHLAYTGGSGTLNVGDTITGGTSGVTGELLRDLTGTLKLRSASGAYADGETLTSTSGWTGTANGTDTVGTLEMLFTQRNLAPTRQGQVNITGEWIELGTSDGTANQTFQFWGNGYCPFVWVETGVGTDEYELWANFTESMTNKVKAGVFGRFFSQVNNNPTITFGDDIWGNIPANGVKIRVPNLYLGKADLASPLVPLLESSLNLAPRFLGNGGSYVIDKLVTTFYLSFTNTTSMSMTDVGAASIFFINETPTQVNLTRVGNTRVLGASGTVNAFSATANPAGVIDTDSFYVADGSAGNNNAVSVTGVPNSTFTRTMAIGVDKTNTNDRAGIIVNSPNLSLDNVFACGQLRIGYSSNATLTNPTLGHSLDGSTSLSGEDNLLLPPNDNTTIDGLTLAEGYNDPFNTSVEVINITSSKNVTIKNIGSYDNPLDITGFRTFINMPSTEDIIIANVHLLGDSTGSLFFTQNTSTNVLFQNVSYNDNLFLNLQQNRQTILSYRGTDDLGLGNGLETDYNSVFDFSYATTFKSDTEGSINILFNEQVNDNLYTILNGTDQEIYFNSLGDLTITAVDNEIEYIIQSPIADSNKILGYTGFQNADPLLRRNLTTPPEPGFLEYTYDIDTGAGFSGTFKALTGANLSGESITPDGGFRLKVRIKCVVAGTSIGNILNGIGILMTTTRDAQKDNLYSIRPASTTVNVSNLDDSSLLIENASGGVEVYQANYTGDYQLEVGAGEVSNWRIVIDKAGYRRQIYSFIPSGGTRDFEGSLSQLLDLEGNPIYQGQTSTNVNVVIAEQRIDVKDTIITGDIIWDEVQVAALTQEGMQDLEIGNIVFYPTSNGNYLSLATWQLRRDVTSTTLPTVNAIVDQNLALPLDESNGQVAIQFTGGGLSANAKQDVRDAMALGLTGGTVITTDSVDNKLDVTSSNALVSATDPSWRE